MTFSAEQLAQNSDFPASLQFLARELRGMFDAGPRLARLLASHQRWLLTQTAYALHLEYDPSDPSSGLTAVRLREAITRHKIASRNTVLSFIDELTTYRFISPSVEHKRRPRRFEPAEISSTAMLGWLSANLAALDLLDNGERARILGTRPEIFHLTQPRLARSCLENEGWREPPERVALFLWTEAGGLVVDHLVSKLDLASANGERLDVGHVDTRTLASQFMISRTHLQRLFARAAGKNCLGWHGERRKTHVWLSRDFLDEYCAWQAIKFSLIDEAFHWAVSALRAE